MLNNINEILLVEDEEALAFGLQRLLQTPANHVDTAHSLAEANDFIKTKSYGAVITDLNLSCANSLEGLEIISTTKALQPGCKIIAITAYGDAPLGDRARALGADFYLEKPVPPRAIKALLHSLGFKYEEQIGPF